MAEIVLKVLEYENIEQIRLWRNEASTNGVYRTPYLLNEKMQYDFYENKLSNRNSNSRFWGIYKKISNNDLKSNELYKYQIIGYCGIDNIQWENRLGEIALTIGNRYISFGYGKIALNLLLTEGFNNLNLLNIYGECYFCNPKIGFWKKYANEHNAYITELPERKYFNGDYYNSLYFNFNMYTYKCNDFINEKEEENSEHNNSN
jgi:RimJ/RimL family protein N-acetyltransferase